nr:serine kinase [Litoreibacter meonggei]
MPFECPSIPCQIHATCVVVDARGLLIVGRSGAGKSSLALQLMAFGAQLVADDRCDLSESLQGVLASKPDGLPEAIEARGVGVLTSPCVGPTILAAVVDLETMTQDRMPDQRHANFGAHQVPLFDNFDAPHLPAALFHFLKYGFHGSMDV